MLPLCVLGFCLRLLSLWGRDSALYGEGSAVRAWHTKTRSVASNLNSRYTVLAKGRVAGDY